MTRATKRRSGEGVAAASQAASGSGDNPSRTQEGPSRAADSRSNGQSGDGGDRGGRSSRRAVRRTYLVVVTVGLLLGVAIVGTRYAEYAMSHVSTDDASIQGHVVEVSPQVPGHVLTVTVTDNQTVTRGELLLAIDPSEYEARLRVLANRNFAVGTLLMGMVGAALYSTIALIPLFLQDLLGYTALQSGLALSPRGVGAVLAMAIIARLVRIIDNRLLILAGFAALAFSIFQFAAINLNTGMVAIVWPNIVNGMAISFIFVPLTTTTMEGLRNDQIGTGTGIFNLMRNLGGSVGIAAATTLLTRGAQIHQAAMVGHLIAYNPVFVHRLQAIAQTLAARVGSAAAAREAYGVIYSTLLTQATLGAFVDNFRLLASLSLCGIPLVFLFRRAETGSAPAVVH